MREFARLVRYDTLTGLSGWRWAAVPVVFVLAGWNEISWLQANVRAPLNLWDGPLSMLLNGTVVIWVLALGFMLLVGDRYSQDRSRGTVALTLIRTRSRTSWWLARVTSIGILALAFSALGLSAALVVSAVRLPLELDPSAAAQGAWQAREAPYPRFEGLPMPAFFGFVVLYTAVALWPLGALVVTASVLSPQLYIPLGAAVLWTLVEAVALPGLILRDSDSADPFYHLLYAAHFTTPGGREGASWVWSACVISTALACAGAIGALKLRRSDM